MQFKHILVSSFLLMAATTSFAAESLFIPSNVVKNVQGKINSVPAIAPGFNARVVPPFAGDKQILSSRVGMRLNPKALDAMELTITLSDGDQVSPKRINRYTTFSGSTVWIGKSTSAPVGSVDYAENETILVMRKGRIIGTVLHAGKMYKIGATPNGDHTLVKIDRGMNFPEHSGRSIRTLSNIIPALANKVTQPAQPSTNASPEISEYDQEWYQAKVAAANKRTTASGAMTTMALADAYPPVVRVLVNYTPAAKAFIEQTGTVQQAVDGFIAQANSIFLNSSVKVRLALAHVEAVSYTESGDHLQDLIRYGIKVDRDPVTGEIVHFMDEIHSQRDLSLADVAVLLTYEENPADSGIAPMDSNSGNAFAVVDTKRAQTRYTFAHEIAHLFGAGHADDTPAPPKAYGHGFASGVLTGDIRTVMAVEVNSSDNSARANVFSNPRLQTLIRGVNVKLGTVDHNDNARVLTEEGPRVSQYYGPPTTFPQTRDWYLIENNPINLDYGIVKFDDRLTGMRIPYSKASTSPLVFTDFIVNLQMKAQIAKVPTATLDRLIELYIAFFNRVPDADGVYYWIKRTTEGMSINQIAESFYASAILYSEQTGYSATMSNEDFIRIVYKNVLGRNDVDQAGLNYWMNALANGSESRGSLVTTILNSAHTFKGDAQYGWVADLLDNKVYVGKYFSVKQGLNYKLPEDNIINGKAIAAAVTPTDTSAAINRIGIRDTAFDSTK